MARKRLTISSGLEQYANAQAQGTSTTMDAETAKAEALAHLRAREHLQTIDELRKALAVVATNTGVDVLHAGTPAPFAAAARTVLMDAFGGCSGAEVEEAIAGAACNATDRSFVVATRDGDAVAAAGVVVEHRFRRADGSPAVTWARSPFGPRGVDRSRPTCSEVAEVRRDARSARVHRPPAK